MLTKDWLVGDIHLTVRSSDRLKRMSLTVRDTVEKTTLQQQQRGEHRRQLHPDRQLPVVRQHQRRHNSHRPRKSFKYSAIVEINIDR